MAKRITEYNGHKNWTQWNVSLWINNDPSLYALAVQAVQHTRTLDKAAEALYSDLMVLNRKHTPDGAAFSKSNLRHAINGMQEMRLSYVGGTR